MSFGYRRIEAVFVVSIFCLALIVPTSAGAATSVYPPNEEARGFGTGLAGWTSSTTSEGTCLAPLLCPSAANSHQASGGADGGGHIRSAYQGVAGVMAVGGTTTAVFTSPQFTYRGVDGKPARAVSFAIDRRASVDQLLAVSGNAAQYSVRLVDDSAGGEAVTLIGPQTLAGANSWREVSRVGLDPGRLNPGHEYRILIASTYTTGTSVVVGGSADYDNVALRATARPSGDGGRTGAGGDGLSRERLIDLVQAATPGTALLSANGKRLFVKVKCPRKAGRKCRIAAQGMLTKRKTATNRRTVKLRKGKSRLLMLRVKPKARDKVVKRKRLLVRHRVRAGKVAATVYKKRKLIRR
jgi:hypothetical protein